MPRTLCPRAKTGPDMQVERHLGVMLQDCVDHRSPHVVDQLASTLSGRQDLDQSLLPGVGDGVCRAGQRQFLWGEDKPQPVKDIGHTDEHDLRKLPLQSAKMSDRQLRVFETYATRRHPWHATPPSISGPYVGASSTHCIQTPGPQAAIPALVLD